MAIFVDSSHPSPLSHHPGLDLLKPLRHWIDGYEVSDRATARLICRLIPSTCPFERDISFLGRTVHIPPLCKLNPLYNELVSLRFRALSYLADICGEDIALYI
ncbi:Mo-dependent nitrogenase C-terminal domain-containing protein [Oscillatoria sp. CS-180]|uniref:Mo-dependent nitrogenase C-terminal domain-containing protein n=1 Tax=Oscillatoria sp. CS-180 TaxID=3021720 RepID=UPI0023304E4E|nr:Mo-dependent nitrogenase C-terminal domain-containing protein [Oscillatoria sp. CS-180]MDB9525430.1 Mo-dependent nitrogenase C-terminal domain-containing protein [Oscillatoria sp. CS-180]